MTRTRTRTRGTKRRRNEGEVDGEAQNGEGDAPLDDVQAPPWRPSKPQSDGPEGRPADEPPTRERPPKTARLSTVGYDHNLSDGPKDIDERTVWIGQVPPTVLSKFQVGEALSQFGQVVHIHIRSDRSFGFAHFEAPESAEAAIEARTFSCGGALVRVSKANQRGGSGAAAGSQGAPDEAVEFFRGRFEKFRKGHGFLRPLEKSAEDDVESSGPPVDQGVYVSQSQVSRFALQDGDLVEAYVRPPRDKDQRNVRLSRSAGESSWALVRVVSVNGTDAEQCDQGPRDKNAEGNADSAAFEWIGRVEMWRDAAHGFLRPLGEDAPEEYRDLVDGDVAEAVGPGGVFVPKEAMQRHHLLDGDIVRALVRRPPPADGPSCTLIDVVEVLVSAPDSEANTNAGDLRMFRGIFESFQKGHGFVRPMADEDATDEDREVNGELEDYLLKGVYVSLAFVQRFSLQNGQKVTVICRPPPDDDGQKSAVTVDVLPTEGGNPKAGGRILSKDAELPPELAHLEGIRIHGIIKQLLPNSASWKFGFLKPDHNSIKDDVFFHKNDVQAWNWTPPKEGDAAFFKVAPNKINKQGDLTLRALEVNFHEAAIPGTFGPQGMPPWGWGPPPLPGKGGEGFVPPPPPGGVPPPPGTGYPPPGWGVLPGHPLWHPGFPGFMPPPPDGMPPGPRPPAHNWTMDSNKVVKPTKAKKLSATLLESRNARAAAAAATAADAARAWTPGRKKEEPWMPAGRPSRKKSSGAEDRSFHTAAKSAPSRTTMAKSKPSRPKEEIDDVEADEGWDDAPAEPVEEEEVELTDDEES